MQLTVPTCTPLHHRAWYKYTQKRRGGSFSFEQWSRLVLVASSSVPLDLSSSPVKMYKLMISFFLLAVVFQLATCGAIQASTSRSKVVS